MAYFSDLQGRSEIVSRDHSLWAGAFVPQDCLSQTWGSQRQENTSCPKVRFELCARTFLWVFTQKHPETLQRKVLMIENLFVLKKSSTTCGSDHQIWNQEHGGWTISSKIKCWLFCWRAVWPWSGWLTSLSLSFPICERRVQWLLRGICEQHMSNSDELSEDAWLVSCYFIMKMG